SSGAAGKYAMTKGWQTVTVQDLHVHPSAKLVKVNIGDHDRTYVTMAHRLEDDKYGIAWESRCVEDRTVVTISEKHRTPLRTVTEAVWEVAGKYTTKA